MKAKKYWYGCVLQQCWFQRQAVDRPQEVLEAMRLVDREYRKARELRRRIFLLAKYPEEVTVHLGGSMNPKAKLPGRNDV